MTSPRDILYKVRIQEVFGNTDLEINSITADSRSISKGSLFVAVKGSVSDGHKYIDNAISSGAKAIVCEALPESTLEHVTYVQVPNSAEALGFLASNFYNNPSEKLKVIAVTGTNGKTTTSTLLFQLFRQLGFSCGLLSTVVNKIDEKEIPSTHTTPDAVSLNSLLNDMSIHGCEFCFMEASSHAIHQHRIAGIEIAGAVFTNITHDHLDYHGDFKSYIHAKKALFDNLPKAAFALINRDDPNADVMVQNTKAKVRSYALKTMADYKCKVLDNLFSGLQLQIEGNELFSKLVGRFNAYNLLAVYAVAREFELDKLEVLTQLSLLESVSGRFQYVKGSNDVTAVVDYAHTPDALENVLKTIQEIRTGAEKVITIVGCGGDRDKSKRPLMAAIAVKFSDQIILTSDNPRSEDPDAIIADMKAGLDPIGNRKSLSLSDRREAIKLACTLANDGDIILIAGKGHETYQEIKGEKFPFDDLAIVSETLKSLQK
jgi:UDP-N-acetylmuramoyl-L-alanyl-D-glutamate--2,6-diaminopimelate ligase